MRKEERSKKARTFGGNQIRERAQRIRAGHGASPRASSDPRAAAAAQELLKTAAVRKQRAAAWKAAVAAAARKGAAAAAAQKDSMVMEYRLDDDSNKVKVTTTPAPAASCTPASPRAPSSAAHGPSSAGMSMGTTTARASPWSPPKRSSSSATSPRETN